MPMKHTLRLLLLYLLAGIGRLLIRQRGDPRRVLVIKPDHLGDVLLMTPALRALRQAMPGALITALVGPWSETMLARNPDIDTLLTCPFPGFARQQAVGNRVVRLLRPYLLLVRYAALLRAGTYGTALLLRDDHWWGAALALLAGIPRRVGYHVPACRPFLTDALPWNPDEHVTMQGLAIVAHFTGTRPNTSMPARFTPPPADAAWAARWCAEHQQKGQRLVIIHPGTGGPTKLWSGERWAQVSDALADAGALVVLTGGPGEEPLTDEIRARAQHPPIDLAGQTQVGQMAALMARAALVLGVDSGPLHIAAAQGVPTIHLYGPGDDGRFGPWGSPERHQVVREPLWCSPCGEFRACPRGLSRPECMDRITAGRVVAQAVQHGGADTPPRTS